MAIIADALKVTPAAPYTGIAATAQTVVQTTAGGNLILNAPGSNRLNGQQFYVAASGYIVTSGGGTFTATVAPILYGDASLATVTTKPLFTATAGTLAYTGTTGAAIPWSLFAELEGDTTSGTFWGNVESQAGSSYKIKTVITQPTSTINFATEPPMKFAVGVTYVGTLGAKAQFVCTQFQLIQE